MMPALLISRSALAVPSANWRTEDRSCRSRGRTSTSPVICFAAAWPLSVLRTAMTIFAPLAASSRAVTAPSPPLAPVMITVRPANDGRSAAVQFVMVDNSTDVEIWAVDHVDRRGSPEESCALWRMFCGVGDRDAGYHEPTC